MSLDIEALLQEISTDHPCGEPLQGEAEFVEFKKKCQGTPEDIFGNPGKDPNWREVRTEGIKLLSRSRDLSIALPLVQALIHTEGLPGLRDGLNLIRGILQRFWDCLYPNLDVEDNNDPTERMILLGTLCGNESILLPAAKSPFVESSKLGRYSFRDLQIAHGKASPPRDAENVPELATLEAAFTDADIGVLQETRALVGECMETLTGIDNFLVDQAGTVSAPDFSPLRELLKEMRFHLGEQLSRRGVGSTVSNEEETVAGTEATAVAPVPAGTLGAVNTRQDVIRALNLICEYYARHEPSSPVPLLLLRAKRLASKDFMEIIKELAPLGLENVMLIAGTEPDADSG